MEYIENLGIMMNRIIFKFFEESNRTENLSLFSVLLLSLKNFYIILFIEGNPGRVNRERWKGNLKEGSRESKTGTVLYEGEFGNT